jgi:hypothetical protein
MYKQQRESVKQYFAGFNFGGLESPRLLESSSACSLASTGDDITEEI